MQYEEALREWGARKIEERNRGVEIDRATVHVNMEFEEGWNCCGGSDPNCYCSLATSGSCSVDITGLTTFGMATSKRRGSYTASISHYDWDFSRILMEIVEVAGGNVEG